MWSFNFPSIIKLDFNNYERKIFNIYDFFKKVLKILLYVNNNERDN